MKTKTTPRGLYRRTTTTTESTAEAFEALELLAGDLDRYVDEAEKAAHEILRGAGIDPETLFDVVTDSRGRYVRHASIDTEALSPEADWALRISIRCHYLRECLSDAAYRNGFAAGILLAQDIEHLNANGWEKPVRVGVRVIDGNPNRKPDRTAEIDQYRKDNEVSLTRAREVIAEKYGENPRTYMRQSKRKKR